MLRRKFWSLKECTFSPGSIDLHKVEEQKVRVNDNNFVGGKKSEIHLELAASEKKRFVRDINLIVRSMLTVLSERYRDNAILKLQI